jgi:enediyne core biosynthesis thioesterase
MQSYFEYRHTVGFAETNLVGNVYFTHYLSWQGRCRELFLLEHAPDVLAELQQGLALVTVRVSCEFLTELVAFDQVAVRMRLTAHAQNRATMSFEYWQLKDGAEELIARGEQQVAAMRRQGVGMAPTPFPPSMQAALEAMARG